MKSEERMSALTSQRGGMRIRVVEDLVARINDCAVLSGVFTDVPPDACEASPYLQAAQLLDKFGESPRVVSRVNVEGYSGKVT